MNHKIQIMQPSLPYAENALESAISANIISYHYGKHHKIYVDKLYELISGTEFEGLPLEEIIQKATDNPDHTGIFNNAAQVWNHTFFWNSLSSVGGGKPAGEFAAKNLR